jgi:uncharacterized protein with ParB-like and HNH nuclease domain
MALWKSYRVVQVVNEIDEGRFVLPVIQRSLVWTEIQMQELFDTVLKGNSFSGIIVIEEDQDFEPLFEYKNFTKDGSYIFSTNSGKLDNIHYFVIDGQQRLQAFYIGLKGSINGKVLFFDLFSDNNSEYEFKFSDNIETLPQTIQGKYRALYSLSFLVSC